MKKYLLLFVMAMSMSVAFASKPVDGHLTGYIDDSMCGGSKTPMCTEATRATCAAKCIKGGAAAVLVVGDKVYKITNQKAVVKYAGKSVTLDGKITGDAIEVTKAGLFFEVSVINFTVNICNPKIVAKAIYSFKNYSFQVFFLLYLFKLITS